MLGVHLWVMFEAPLEIQKTRALGFEAEDASSMLLEDAAGSLSVLPVICSYVEDDHFLVRAEALGKQRESTQFSTIPYGLASPIVHTCVAKLKEF